MVTPNPSDIAMLNDRFRQGDPKVPGRWFATVGISELLKRHDVEIDRIVEAVLVFDSFTEDNDPHGEHDFGQFEYLGETCFWKIDCYDNDYEMGSDDPTDLNITKRVLTIMLAGEW